MGKASDWLREERRKTLGDWVAFCRTCGFAQRYFDESEGELPKACPDCGGEMRSRCPECDHEIRWYHNVPVLGWIMLGGRCYDCGARIPVKHPLIELAFALVFIFAGLPIMHWFFKRL